MYPYLMITLVVLLMFSGCDAADVGITDLADTPHLLNDASFSKDDASMDALLELWPDLPIPETSVCDLDIALSWEPAPDIFGPLDVAEACTVAREGAAIDAGPVCVPLRMDGCACVDGRSGARTCGFDGHWGLCRCTALDGGVDAVIDLDASANAPIPPISGPRLLAPQSGTRASSQRPTFRWMSPDGISRVRVDLCADRSCARLLARQEVVGMSWRPTEPLSSGVVFWRVEALGASGATVWTSATWEVGIRHRDAAVDTSYGPLKDFNGDGYDDLVGLSSFDQRTFAARVFPGSVDGVHSARFLGLNPPLLPDSPTDTGEFGHPLAVGDLNGDGLADLVAGAWGIGRVFVFFGSRECLLSRYDGIYQAPRPGHPYFYGTDVSVGDFNGDGFGDMVVTGGGSEAARGAAVVGEEVVQLHRGTAHGPEEVASETLSEFGRSAHFIGDVNGDGYQEIATRTFDDDGGVVVVLYGNPDAHLMFHVQRLTHPLFVSHFGRSMRWGDLNEDGYADLLVTNGFSVLVYYGSPEGLQRSVVLHTPPGTSWSDVQSYGFAEFLGWPGDLDGDGHAEFAVGAPGAPSRFLDVSWQRGQGQAFVYTAASGDIAPQWARVLEPRAPSEGFGTATIPGDLNGDGYDDLAVAADSHGGEIYVYHGGPGVWWCSLERVLQGITGRTVLGAWLE